MQGPVTWLPATSAHGIARMKFKITYISVKQRRVTLFARQLGAGEFTLSDSPMLGGCSHQTLRVTSITPHGKPDLSQFSFVLSTASDLPKLGVRLIVELT